jgi:hypothetical protein
MKKFVLFTPIILLMVLFLITCENNTNPLELEQNQAVPNDVESCWCPPPTPPPTGCGRMTGGGSVWVGDMRVTRGFEIHCDVSKPNNIEVNWPGGNNFHLTKLLSATCRDNPYIHQEPPAAPFDTFIGEGEGIWSQKGDKEIGAKINFKFIDAGEPGVNDWAMIRITSNGSQVILVRGFLKKGNLQAHDDKDCQEEVTYYNPWH